ncbi:MAG: hypothetical protein AAFY60_07625 [Myxococcota bacterium]
MRADITQGLRNQAARLGLGSNGSESRDSGATQGPQQLRGRWDGDQVETQGTAARGVWGSARQLASLLVVNEDDLRPNDPSALVDKFVAALEFPPIRGGVAREADSISVGLLKELGLVEFGVSGHEIVYFPASHTLAVFDVTGASHKLSAGTSGLVYVSSEWGEPPTPGKAQAREIYEAGIPLFPAGFSAFDSDEGRAFGLTRFLGIGLSVGVPFVENVAAKQLELNVRRSYVLEGEHRAAVEEAISKAPELRWAQPAARAALGVGQGASGVARGATDWVRGIGSWFSRAGK